MKIACDFDKTLAEYHGKGSFKTYEYGKPIMPMVNRLKHYLDEGHEVIIFTARVYPHKNVPDWNEEKIRSAMQNWLEENELPRLEITCMKFNDIDVFLDDKAVSVNPNGGYLSNNEGQLPKMKEYRTY